MHQHNIYTFAWLYVQNMLRKKFFVTMWCLSLSLRGLGDMGENSNHRFFFISNPILNFNPVFSTFVFKKKLQVTNIVKVLLLFESSYTGAVLSSKSNSKQAVSL